MFVSVMVSRRLHDSFPHAKPQLCFHAQDPLSLVRRASTWMSERHGMPALEGEQRAQFLDYLTAHFGPGTGGPGRSPFLTQPQRKNPFAQD